MKINFLFLVLILISVQVNADITEIMYDYPGNDNNKEYVEVVFDVPTSMDGWTVKDNSNEDIILLLDGDGNSKINLIVEESYSADYFDNLDFDIVSVYSAGAAIGNGLGNNGDTVSLHDLDNNLVDSVEYDDSLAKGDGNAICISEGSYYSCVPSPGVENSNDTDVPRENKTVFEINLSGVEKKKIEKKDGEVRIEYIENPIERGCKYLNVYVSMWNDLDTDEDVRAYVQEIGVVTTLHINPQSGQIVELPVATCNDTIGRKRGDYVVVVEGFGEKDMKLVYLNGFEYKCEEEHVSLRNTVGENNIKTVSEVKTELKSTKTVINAGESVLRDVGFYLTYFVGGLGVYYVLFKA